MYQTPAQRGAHQTPRQIYTVLHHNQVVPMDIDTGNMGGPSSSGNPPPYQGRGGFTQLSNAEKADLITKSACFKCKQPGHISWWYGKRKPILENARQGPSTINIPNETPAPPKQTMIETLGGVEGIYNMIKNGTEAEKEKFMDLAQDF